MIINQRVINLKLQLFILLIYYINRNTHKKISIKRRTKKIYTKKCSTKKCSTKRRSKKISTKRRSKKRQSGGTSVPKHFKPLSKLEQIVLLVDYYTHPKKYKKVTENVKKELIRKRNSSTIKKT